MTFTNRIRRVALVAVAVTISTGAVAQSINKSSAQSRSASAVGAASAPTAHPVPHRLDPAILAAIQRNSQALLHAQQEQTPSAQTVELKQTLQSLRSDVHQYLVKHPMAVDAQTPESAETAPLHVHLDHLRKAHDDFKQASAQDSGGTKQARSNELAMHAQRIGDELDQALSASTRQERADRLAKLDTKLTPESLHSRIAHLATHPQVTILADGSQIESPALSDTPTPDQPITTFSKRTDINDITVERSRRTGRFDLKQPDGKQDARHLAPASSKQTNSR